MGKNGPEFYDDEEVFATYAARRARIDGPNEILEKPIFDELIGDLAGLRILDLGCGDAAFGIEALQQGCESYLGIDGSHKMVAAAKAKLAGTAERWYREPSKPGIILHNNSIWLHRGLHSIMSRRSRLCLPRPITHLRAGAGSSSRLSTR